MVRRAVWLLIPALALGGCSTIPNVTVSYYFPRAKTQFVVTQTVGCSPKVDGKHRIIRSVISATATTTNAADLDFPVPAGKTGATPYQGRIEFSAFKGSLSDADATVTLTPDGRLSGVNATSTGEGDTIIKDLVTVASAVALMGAPPAGGPHTVEDNACDQVDNFSATPATGDGKTAAVVTLTYTVTVSYTATTALDLKRQKIDPTFAIDLASSPAYSAGDLRTVTLLPDPPSKPAYDALHGILQNRMETSLTMVSTATDARFMTSTSPLTVAKGDEYPLELNKVAILRMKIDGRTGDLTQTGQVWSGFVPVPMRETYSVPIPSPVSFGKTAFGISLSDYGSITSLHYGSASGAPDAADAAGAIAKALQSNTPEDKANELKGQADLIAQQQRLIACQVTPTTCK